MAGTLGCATTYSAFITTKDGLSLGELPMTSVTWGRTLDDISEATIEVPLSGKDCEPCDLIAQLHTWHHHLVIIRDGQPVWDGPVVLINVSRTVATITARDLFQLLAKRIIHEDHCFGVACGAAALELTEIAKILLADAFALDGHGYTVLVQNLTNLLGEWRPEIGRNAYEVFGEELKLGLDATWLGRRLVIGAAPFGRTSLLTSEDFLVDLEFEEDGLTAATRAITLGDGFVGIATSTGDDIGDDPYYGLLEYEGTDRNELGTQDLADQAAAAILASLYPPPVSLITPAGAALSPNAPVTIQELVPGMLIPIIATDLCREVGGEYILIKLDVTWSEDSGESVQITAGTVASANSGEGTT